MSDALSGLIAKERVPGPLFSLGGLVIGVVIAIALIMLAINSAPPPGFKAAGPIGTIQAVTLLNGQVYYGTLKSEDKGVFVLNDVFEVQTVVNPTNNQRTAQLNRRRSVDWHGPLDMAIPADKILFTESVGRDSQVAKAIAQIQSAPASTTNPPPASPAPPPAPPK